MSTNDNEIILNFLEKGILPDSTIYFDPPLNEDEMNELYNVFKSKNYPGLEKILRPITHAYLNDSGIPNSDKLLWISIYNNGIIGWQNIAKVYIYEEIDDEYPNKPNIEIHTDEEGTYYILNNKDSIEFWVSNEGSSYERLMIDGRKFLIGESGYDLFDKLNESEEDEFEWARNIVNNPIINGWEFIKGMYSHSLNEINFNYNIIIEIKNEDWLQCALNECGEGITIDNIKEIRNWNINGYAYFDFISDVDCGCDENHGSRYLKGKYLSLQLSSVNGEFEFWFIEDWINIYLTPKLNLIDESEDKEWFEELDKPQIDSNSLSRLGNYRLKRLTIEDLKPGIIIKRRSGKFIYELGEELPLDFLDWDTKTNLNGEMGFMLINLSNGKRYAGRKHHIIRDFYLIELDKPINESEEDEWYKKIIEKPIEMVSFTDSVRASESSIKAWEYVISQWNSSDLSKGGTKIIHLKASTFPEYRLKFYLTRGGYVQLELRDNHDGSVSYINNDTIELSTEWDGEYGVWLTVTNFLKSLQVRIPLNESEEDEFEWAKETIRNIKTELTLDDLPPPPYSTIQFEDDDLGIRTGIVTPLKRLTDNGKGVYMVKLDGLGGWPCNVEIKGLKGSCYFVNNSMKVKILEVPKNITENEEKEWYEEVLQEDTFPLGGIRNHLDDGDVILVNGDLTNDAGNLMVILNNVKFIVKKKYSGLYFKWVDSPEQRPENWGEPTMVGDDWILMGDETKFWDDKLLVKIIKKENHPF